VTQLLLLATLCSGAGIRVDPVARTVDLCGATAEPHDPAPVDVLAPAEVHWYELYPNRAGRWRVTRGPGGVRLVLPRRYGSGGCVGELCWLEGEDFVRGEVVAVHGRSYADPTGPLVVVGTRLHSERRAAWTWIGRGSGQRALAVAARVLPGGGTMVEVPMRDALARRVGATVLVSDRLFRVASPLGAWHERALVRVLTGTPPREPADLRVTLRPLGFIPAVDRTLYAQPVPFADVYLFAPPPPHWKLVWRNFSAAFSTDTLSLAGSIDLALRRTDDLAHTYRFGILHDAASEIGGFVGAERGFGRHADPDRLAGALGLTITAARIGPDFAGLGRPGTSLAATLGVAWDDRAWPVDPWRFKLASVSATARHVTVADNAAASDGIFTAALGGGVPLAHGLVLAGLVRGSAVVGDLTYAAEMLEAGGIDGLRGFAVDELPGRTVLLGRAELRRTFTRDWDISLSPVAYVRGFGMALFWEGALVGTCSGALTQSGYQDAGITFRAFFDWAGLVPTVLELDLAWPLDRRQRTCLGAVTSPGDVAGQPRSPTAVLLRFGPSF
jgi:hypothetical protein